MPRGGYPQNGIAVSELNHPKARPRKVLKSLSGFRLLPILVVKLLYVGIRREGTTSRQRSDTLEHLLPDWDHLHIDVWPSFARHSRLNRSLAFRFKRGPAIHAINRDVLTALRGFPSALDLIWVDKAVFLEPDTTLALRERSTRMVHYTPDSAFFQNRSHLFERSGSHYDLLVTTKSFELEKYREHFPRTALKLTTQGYDEKIHRPQGDFSKKNHDVVFAGLCERSRERAIKTLIETGITVALAGHGWKGFAARFRTCPYLKYSGGPLEGGDYARFLFSGKLGLGLLSKRFPELHTTRTFEIPACGTALVTEANEETASFFDPREAVFFNREENLAAAVTRALSDSESLQRITAAGRKRIERDRRGYRAILEGILNEVLES